MSQSDSFDELRPGLEAGDEEAAAEVFRRYAHRLIGLARGRLDAQIRRKVDPEDVVQSVMKSFFRRHADEQFELKSWDSLWSLLVVMTVRKCGRNVELLRAARRDVRKETHETADAAASSWRWEAMSDEPTASEAVALTDTLEQLMASLSEREQQILTLRLQGYDVPEIAERVQRSERTVQRLLKGIKERLERML